MNKPFDELPPKTQYLVLRDLSAGGAFSAAADALDMSVRETESMFFQQSLRAIEQMGEEEQSNVIQQILSKYELPENSETR